MCNVWKTPCKELSTENIFKIIDRLDILGIAHIQLTGGEPFLREDIVDIYRYAKQKGISVYISTNGTLPLSVYKKVILSPVNDIGVSLHSINANIQERINGVRGSWKKTIETIKFLKSSGKNVYICCVVSSLNLLELPEIIKFCEDELNVPIGLQPAVMGESKELIFRGKDDSLKNIDYLLVERQIKQIRMHGMRRTRTFMNNAFKVLSNENIWWNCRAGRMFCAIMPDGKFGICQDILTDINILDDDFFEKINSKDFKNNAAELAKRCKKCAYSCYYDTTNMFAHPLEALELGIRCKLFHFLKT